MSDISVNPLTTSVASDDKLMSGPLRSRNFQFKPVMRTFFTYIFFYMRLRARLCFHWWVTYLSIHWRPRSLLTINLWLDLWGAIVQARTIHIFYYSIISYRALALHTPAKTNRFSRLPTPPPPPACAHRGRNYVMIITLLVMIDLIIKCFKRMCCAHTQCSHLRQCWLLLRGAERPLPLQISWKPPPSTPRVLAGVLKCQTNLLVHAYLLSSSCSGLIILNLLYILHSFVSLSNVSLSISYLPSSSCRMSCINNIII